MTFRLTTMAAALIGAPALALAQCPTGADLASGISFRLDDGAKETYKAEGSDRVVVTYVAEDGYQSRLVLGKGIYLLEFAEVADGAVDPDTRVTYSHSLTPEKMPIPQAQGRWVSEVAVLDAGTPASEIHNHKFGPNTQITIGECSYDMMPITVFYNDADRTIDHLEYMPSLGFAVLAGSSYLGEDEEREEEFYTYFDIQAERSGGGSSGGKKGKKSE